MRTARQAIIGLFSMVFLVSGVAMVMPLGSEAEASGWYKKGKRVTHKKLHKDHKNLGYWIEKIEKDLKEIKDTIGEPGAGGGEGGDGNHTLRWDQDLDSTNGVTEAEDPTRVGCDSDRFTCIFNDTAVLDGDTGIVWQRQVVNISDGGDPGVPWTSAKSACITTFTSAKGGWRLPSIHELLSLQTPGVVGFPNLPPGHPFTGVPITVADGEFPQIDFWSATRDSNGSALGVWVGNFGGVGGGGLTDPEFENFVWCVRGGGPISDY